MQRDGDRCRSRACRSSCAASGVSMPCTTALRSMCSNGGSMRSSTWRSSSPEAPSIAELGLLVRVGGGLAHDARQALHVALERHHARAHQAVLQLGDRAGLLRAAGSACPWSGSRATPGCCPRRWRSRPARARTAGSTSSGRARADRIRRARPFSSSWRCRICASVSISSLRSCSFRRVTVRDSSPRLKSIEPICCSRRARAMLTSPELFSSWSSSSASTRASSGRSEAPPVRGPAARLPAAAADRHRPRSR